MPQDSRDATHHFKPAGTQFSWGAGCDAVTSTTCTINSLTANTAITLYALPNMTSASCPSGTVGASYLCNLTATGGKLPYAWNIAAGTLQDSRSTL